MIGNNRLQRLMQEGRPKTVSDDSWDRYKRLYQQRFGKKVLPKALLFDIETAPHLGYVWGLYNQDIHPVQIEREGFIICWAAKWLFSSNVMSRCLDPVAAVWGDDSSLVFALWDLLDDADVVITQNGDKFDIPWANYRFLLNGLPPPSPYQSVDTYKQSKQFRFPSHRLDYMSEVLSGEKKLPTDFTLWKRCMKGDDEALAEMLEYCEHDVYLLEDLYMYMRPWMKSHPNMALYQDGDEMVCSVCGSEALTAATTVYRTVVNAYAVYRCSSCGALTRVKQSSKSVKGRGVVRTGGV